MRRSGVRTPSAPPVNKAKFLGFAEPLKRNDVELEPVEFFRDSDDVKGLEVKRLDFFPFHQVL